jgi:hypothetical protein
MGQLVTTSKKDAFLDAGCGAYASFSKHQGRVLSEQVGSDK